MLLHPLNYLFPLAHLQPPSQNELISYGISPEFIEFIRSLNYNTFRDFSSDGAGPTDAPASGADAPDAPALNPWQVRHAMLVVRVVQEVNELRYVLCPRYMDDQRFWQVYFALAKPHLPSAAFSWEEGDTLPPISGAQDDKDTDPDPFMSLTGFQDQIKHIGTKLQAAATAAATAAKHAKGPGGVELATLLPLGVGATRDGADAVQDDAGGATGLTQDASLPLSQSGTLLEADPDLEAYLQVADEARDELADSVGEEDLDVEEDLDLDQYLNELSAEVEEGGLPLDEEGGDGDEVDGVDVDAVLRELQEEEENS